MIPILLLALVAQAGDLAGLRKQFEAERALPFLQRYGTLSQVGELKTPEAAEFLGQVFDADSDASVKSYALYCLGTCGGPEAARRLCRIARDESMEISLRMTAVASAARTRVKEGVDLAVSIARDRNPANALRAGALAALVDADLKDTESLWRESLADEMPYVRAYALRALAPLKDAAILDLARKALLDSREAAEVRSASIVPWTAVGGAVGVANLLAAAPVADCNLRGELEAALVAVANGGALDALLAGLKRTDPAIRALAVRALGATRAPAGVEPVEAAIRDREVVVRIAALEAVAARHTAESAELLRREAARGDDEASLVAISLLDRYPSDATVALLVKLADQGLKMAHYMTVLDVLGRLKRPEALGIFERALDRRDWPVRSAAIQGLRGIHAKESIDLLIGRISKEEGRLHGDVLSALGVLTGKDLGPKQGPWVEWWKVAREAFTFPAPAGAGPRATVTYHGLPVVSRRLAFCLDVSGSMMAEVGGYPRLEVAKRELARVLSALDAQAQANLVFFHDSPKAWQPSLVPVRPNLARALEAIKAVQVGGGTNVFDSLELAFKDRNVDSIYLLSDGMPNLGKFVQPDDILKEIRAMNRTRRITIHAVSFGPNPFMKRLAAENGGEYVEK